MNSASDVDRSGLWWRGIVAAAAAGACVGLADVLCSLVSRHELVQARDAFDVVIFYAACFAPCGLIAALFARPFDLPRRALHLFVSIGATFFFVGAWMNTTWLPGFTSALSLTVDVVLVLLCALLFWRRYRDTALDSMRTGRWFVAGVVAVGIAFAISELVPPRGDGPPPQATVAPRAGTPDNPWDRGPNVLLYLCDTLRADHLGCYGYEKATSPEIDAFAKDATLFADCRAPTSWTKPSVASLLTSLYPSVHACVEQRDVLVPAAETMAEVFRAAGWETSAFVDNPFISPEFGFGQGIEPVDYHYVRPSVVANGTLLGKALFMTRLLSLVGKPFGVGDHVERGAPALHEEFLEMATDRAAREHAVPWFAYVHAMEPHLPYEPSRADAEAMGLAPGRAYASPPKGYNGILPFDVAPEPDADFLASLVAQYDGEIRGFSRSFGALIDTMRANGTLENTIVVFVADHGEEFHEHGGWTHGHSLHREVVGVPLIVRLPDVLATGAAASRGRTIRGVTSLLDVLPTLVDLCGIRWPRGEERRFGLSLVPQLLPSTIAPGSMKSGSEDFVQERDLYSELTMSPVGIRAIRRGRWQLLEAYQPGGEAVALYDDVSDPQHRRDRTDQEVTEVSTLRNRLAATFRLFEDAGLVGAERDIDPETAESLRKIGYFGGGK